MAKLKSKAFVEKDLAIDHARMTFRRAWAGDIMDMESWGTAELDPDPLEIYDINGDLLFYEYTAMDGNKQVGRIKASATKRLGTPVPTLEQGPRVWEESVGVKMATNAVKKSFPKAKIEGTQLVCYSYPKIGVRVDIVVNDGRKQSLIFDVADGTMVERFGADELEGQSAWSFLDNLSPSDQEAAVKMWDLRDEEREAARSTTKKLFAKGFTSREAQNAKSNFVVESNYRIPFYSSKIIKFGPRCNPHECFELYAQQTNVYCAVATGQMILDFYRYYYDQDDIATAMGTGAGGTGNSGQVVGYESLSKNCLNATYDNTANWNEAKAEIDANRPLKSGVPGHARACAGWKRQNIFIIGQKPKRWLRIYDPWP